MSPQMCGPAQRPLPTLQQESDRRWWARGWALKKSAPEPKPNYTSPKGRPARAQYRAGPETAPSPPASWAPIHPTQSILDPTASWGRPPPPTHLPGKLHSAVKGLLVGTCLEGINGTPCHLASSSCTAGLLLEMHFVGGAWGA